MNPIVYRIQDSEGRGPFKPGFSRSWIQDREDLDNLVPWTIELSKALVFALVGAHHGCGCQTLDQLRRWFTAKEYTTLLYYGYHAVQMEVDRILDQSETQCVFERSKPLKNDVTPVELYPVAHKQTHARAVARI